MSIFSKPQLYKKKYLSKQLYRIPLLSLLILSCFAVYSFILLFTINVSIQRLSREALEVATAAFESSIHAAQMDKTVALLINSGSFAEAKDLLQTLRTDEEAILFHLNTIFHNIEDSKGKDFVHSAMQTIALWSDARTRAVNALLHEDSHMSGKRIAEESFAFVDTLNSQMHSLKSHTRSFAETRILQIQNLVLRSLIFFLLISFLVLVSLFLGTRHLIQSVQGSIEILKKPILEFIATNQLIEAESEAYIELNEIAQGYNLAIGLIRDEFWFKDGINKLNTLLHTHQNLPEISKVLLSWLFAYTQASSGNLTVNYDNYHYSHNIPPQAALKKSASTTIGFPLISQKQKLGSLELSFATERADKLHGFLQACQKNIANHLYSIIQSEEISRLFCESEKNNEQKSLFLSKMSHELRTPLNSIMLLSQDLLQNRESLAQESITESLEIIHKSGSDLLILINELLDHTKIESGKLDCYCEPFSVSELIDNILRIFRPQAVAKGLELVCNLENTSTTLVSDSRKIEQILKNLLSNALKFTDSGYIEISVHTLQKKNEGSISIHVKDTGPGVKAENLEKIFQPFQQGSAAAASSSVGTGLGLTISRELARFLNGDIFVNTHTAKGAEFILHLPHMLGKSCNSPEPQSEKDFSNQRSVSGPEFCEQPIKLYDFPKYVRDIFSQTSILLVDTNMQRLFSLSHALSSYSFAVYKADDSHTALRILKANPDIGIAIITNSRLDNTALHFCQKMRAETTLPIFMQSNEFSEDMQQDLHKTIPDIHLTKPLDIQELLTKIQDLLLASR